MKNRLTFALISVVLGLTFQGCSTTAGTSTISSLTAQLTPTVLAKGAQDVIAAAGGAILAKNPKYVGDVLAAADVFTAIATSNPAALTGADVAAALATGGVSSANQSAISTYVSAALALYQSDFKINFPTLQPNYALFATAIANGLNVAAGNTSKVVALPVVPAPAPAPAAAPAA